LAEALRRLSKKTGVLASVALDRKTGAVLQSSGNLGILRSSSSSSITSPNSGEPSDIQEVATMVWEAVRNMGNVIHGLDAEVSSLVIAPSA
jgi:dynein light chain roadblock-type